MSADAERPAEGPAIRTADPWSPLRELDVVEPILERLPEPTASSRPAPLSHLHAVPGLGAAKLLRTWLVRHGVEDRVEWHDLDGQGRWHPESSTGPAASTLVLEGVDLPWEDLGLEAAFGRYQHVVVIGTTAPDSWSTPWPVDVYHGRDMVLTRDEIARVARGRGVDLSGAAVTELAAQSGGWPMLVDATLRAYRRGDRVEDVRLGLAEARPYVAGRVLARLRPDLGEAARLLAVAGEMTDHELRAFGDATSAAVVDLRRLGLAEAITVDGMPAYRLLGMVADAAFGPGGTLVPATDVETRELLLELARNREQAGMGDRGLGFAYRARDWRLCSRLIDHWWPEIAFTSHRERILRIEQEMPEVDRKAYPGTWYRAEYRGHAPVGEAPLRIPRTEAAIAELVRSGDAHLELKRTLMAMIARRVHHRYREAHAIAVQGRLLAETHLRPGKDPTKGVAAFWYLHAGIAHELVGEHEASRRLFRAGWTLRGLDGTGHMGIDIAGKLAAQAAWRGERDEAQRWLDEQPHALDPDEWYSDHIRGGYAQATTLLADDRLDLEAASRAVLVLDRPMTVDEYWLARVAARVHHLLTWGEPQTAYDALVAARDAHRDALSGDGMHRSISDLFLADIAIAQGRGTLARRLLDGCADEALAGPLRARLALLAGEDEDALARADVALQGPLSRRQRAEVLLLRAVAAARCGDRGEALAAASAAVARVRSQGHLRAVCTVPRHELQDLAPEVPGLETLLEEVARTGAPDIYPAQVVVVELSEREQVVLQLLARGRSLQQAADDLVVSVNTVKTQARSLYARLGVKDRRTLLVEAARLGLLDPWGGPGAGRPVHRSGPVG